MSIVCRKLIVHRIHGALQDLVGGEPSIMADTVRLFILSLSEKRLYTFFLFLDCALRLLACRLAWASLLSSA